MWVAYVRHTAVVVSVVACSSATTGGNDASSHDSATLAPTTLRSFESNAEGIGDACKIADYVKAQAIVGEAKTNWNVLEPLASSAGVPIGVTQKIAATLDLVASDISATKQRACETDANVITLTVPDIFDHFVYAVPSDGLRGDGVFRQLQIDAEYAAFETADADLAAAEAVWNRLGPLVSAQAPKHADIPGAATVVADTDTTMMQLRAAIDAKSATDLATASQAGLDEIDTMESIFK